MNSELPDAVIAIGLFVLLTLGPAATWWVSRQLREMPRREGKWPTVSHLSFCACVVLSVAIAVVQRASFEDINWWGLGNSSPTAIQVILGPQAAAEGIFFLSIIPWGLAIGCWCDLRIPRQLPWLGWSLAVILFCLFTGCP